LEAILTVPKTAATSIAFSPDGEMLAIGTHSGQVLLYEFSAQKFVQVFQGHTDHVSSVAFSPDGKWLASGSRDKTIRLWKVGG
jgi:WD40 repeat protein